MAKKSVRKPAVVKPAAPIAPPAPEIPPAIVPEPEPVITADTIKTARVAQIAALFPDAGFVGDFKDRKNLEDVIIAAFEVGRRKMLRGV